jgi:cyclic dehypoxanthinyl futalosine synthase
MSETRDLLDLYARAPLLELGDLADRARERRHPHGVVTYIVDRNINYTNVCVADCGFCAFARRPKHGEGYTLSYEQIGQKIDETKAMGGVQILIQGGHNPYIPFDWYLDLLRYIKRHHPIHVHGFSPSEVDFFAERFRMDARDVVRELRAPGSTRSRAAAARSSCSACATTPRRRRPAPTAGSRSWRSRTRRG